MKKTTGLNDFKSLRDLSRRSYTAENSFRGGHAPAPGYRETPRQTASGLAGGIAAPGRKGRLDVELLAPAGDARGNVIIAGCAPALGLLADRASTGAGRTVWLPRSSSTALTMLARNHTHVAGVHLVDQRTKELNLPDVRRLVPRRSVTVITLARWEIGLVVPRGNPQRIRAVADLARPGLRLVAREEGSGARRVLDRALATAGARRSRMVLANGHLEVAHAVALGAADTGVATRDAALEYGLELVALDEERYDLVVPTDSLADERVVRVLDTMCSSAFRRDVASVGYDVTSCGVRVSEVGAA